MAPKATRRIRSTNTDSKGKFVVKLTVTDDGELTGVAEETIEVVNLPPEVAMVKPGSWSSLDRQTNNRVGGCRP